MRGCVRSRDSRDNLLSLGVWTGVSSRAAADSRPNVVVIITDDQGYGDLGVHGNPKIKTPNLDAFARQSVRLKNFYVSPVCSPTRASLLDGPIQLSHRRGRHLCWAGR